MRLVFHGGKCCGIRTIYGLPTCIYNKGSPEKEQVVPINLDKKDVDPKLIVPDYPDIRGNHVSSDKDFYPYYRPMESVEERLEEFLIFLRKHRPNGIVEVALAESEGDQTYLTKQKTLFEPLLLKHGFKEVSSCKNSNTGRRIHVYRLCME